MKVQCPIPPTEPGAPWLIYPKERHWQQYLDAEELPQDVRRAVQAHKGKAYFHATVGNNNKLSFGVLAPPQNW